MTTPTRYEALCLVRAHFDTEESMAAAFDVTQPTVWRWLNQSRQLPAEKVLLAETLTKVSCHWLRPDIYPLGLVVGEPFSGDEPELDVFADVTLPPRETRRDTRIDARFHGVDRRAGARA